MTVKHEYNYKPLILDYWVILLILNGVICLFVLPFCTIWAIKVFQHLIQSIKSYRINKKIDFLDTRVRKRILYNYETHIVKDVILLILCCAEISEPIILLLFRGVIIEHYQYWLIPKQSTNTTKSTNITKSINPCTPDETVKNIIYTAWETFDSGWGKFFYPIFFIGALGFLLLLSFLAQYLSKRYFLHPIKKSLFSHLMIFFLQSLTIGILLSNNYTAILLHFIIPIFCCMDWYIFFKSSRNLGYVLRSNLRDLSLHFTHRRLYTEQWKLYQTYRFFMPVLLAALGFAIFSIVLHNCSKIFEILLNSKCLFSYSSNTNENFDKFQTSQHISLIISKIIGFAILLIQMIHFILLGFPLYVISIGMVCSVCYGKCCEKKRPRYRYNYRNLAHLLEKFNIHPPY